MEPKRDSEEKLNSQEKENIHELKDKCARLEQEKEELSARLNWYEEQFRLSKQKQFGSSSEKTDDNKRRLFDEAEVEADPKAEEPTVEEITYRRRKGKTKKDRIPEDLPVETVEYELSEEELDCPQCSNKLHKMSKETRKEIEVIPAQVKVKEHVRNIYSCRSCEKNEISTPVVTAPMPVPVLPGSMVSPSLMSFIMARKYSEALPLYRQEQLFKDFGIDISRQTMANWMIRGSKDWLSHLWTRMHREILKKDILHADETTLQVLHEEGKTAANKSYMWLYATGHTDIPIFLYDYRTTRGPASIPRICLQVLRVICMLMVTRDMVIFRVLRWWAAGLTPGEGLKRLCRQCPKKLQKVQL